MRHRRVLLLVLLACVLGAVTTVSLAWMAAWRFHREASSFSADQNIQHVPATSGDRVSLEIVGDPGCRLLIWSNHDFLGAPGLDLSDVFTTDHPIDMPTLADSTPSWSRLDLSTYRQTITEAWVMEYAFGWPSRTMYAMTVDAPPALHDSIVGDVGWTQPHSRGPGVPLLPIWPRFIRDALMFAVGWLVLIPVSRLAVRSVIEWRRRRRGACSRCGYLRDPSAAVPRCPECGWAFDRAG